MHFHFWSWICIFSKHLLWNSWINYLSGIEKKWKLHVFFINFMTFSCVTSQNVEIKKCQKNKKKCQFRSSRVFQLMKSSYVPETSFESMFWTFFSLSLKTFYTSRLSIKSPFRFSTVFRFIKMFIKKRLSLDRIEHKSVILLDINNDFLWSE